MLMNNRVLFWRFVSALCEHVWIFVLLQLCCSENINKLYWIDGELQVCWVSITKHPWITEDL